MPETWAVYVHRLITSGRGGKGRSEGKGTARVSGGLDYVRPVTDGLPGFPDGGKRLTVPGDRDRRPGDRRQDQRSHDGWASSFDSGGKTECPSGECAEYQNENRQRNRYPIHVFSLR